MPNEQTKLIDVFYRNGFFIGKNLSTKETVKGVISSLTSANESILIFSGEKTFICWSIYFANKD